MIVVDLFGDFLSNLLDFKGEEEPKYSWADRPKSTSGEQFEYGDHIILACRWQRTITTYVPVLNRMTPIHRTKIEHGFIGWVERDGRRWPELIVTDEKVSEPAQD
jgi:hypothetical protein